MAKLPALLLAMGLLAGVAVAFVPSARAATVSINLYGSVSTGWGQSSTSESTPGPTLTVNQGDVVTITLHSTDGVGHEFFIDLNGNGRPDTGEPTSGVFSTTATLSFTASTAGTFRYYCYFHEASMYGTFTVTGSGSPAPTGGSTSSSLDPVVLGAIIVVVAAVAGVTLILLRRKR